MDLPEPKIVLLVTGSGRSGTSSLAGSLKHLGWHVPQPEVPAADRNSKGHFEPQWVISFHKRALRRVGVGGSDSRPDALEQVAQIQTDELTTELAAWLDTHQQDRLVIKDPHAVMFLPTWRSAAQALGRDLRVLTAVRHPAEVIGSRDLAWGQGRKDAERRVKEISNAASWINVALATEAGTRGLPRALLRYQDLITDWRTTLGRVSDQLQLGLDLAVDRPHELDTWLDPGMRRSEVTWDDIVVPERLQSLAERAWHQLNRLVEDPGDPEALAELDTVRPDYDELYAEARALVTDDTVARNRAREEKVQQLRQRVRRRDAEIERLRDGAPPPGGQ